MTTIEAARAVKESGTCHLIRLRKDSPGQYDARPFGGGNKRGWAYLDLFTASAICAVYDALSEANREKYGRMPVQLAASFAFKHVK